MNIIVLFLSLWLFVLLLSFLEPILWAIGGILNFVKSRWYWFVIVLWLMRS
jgi:hypothetical protein